MHSCMVQGLCAHCVFLSSLCSPFPDVYPPCLLVPDGHFEPNFPTSTSTSLRPPSTASLSCARPEIAGHAYSKMSGEEFVYMADSAHSTGYEPKMQLKKRITSLRIATRRPSTIQTATTSQTSPESHVKTLDDSVFLMFVLTHLFCMVFCLKSASFGKPRAATNCFRMFLVIGTSFGTGSRQRERED